MAIDFPSSPSVGQQYTYSNVTYIYTAQGVWSSYTSPVADATFGFTTGDVKITTKVVADPGWIMFDDNGSIGSASSGATNANATMQALFLLWFVNIGDPSAPIKTSAGAATTRAAQGTAAAAWAANCRISMPRAIGRALGVAGSGAGLTTRVNAEQQGTESFTPTAANTYAHYHQPSAASGGNFWVYLGGGYTLSVSYGGGITDTTASFTTTVGSSVPFSLMQPTIFFNCMVKL